jgi:hypothetical protein
MLMLFPRFDKLSAEKNTNATFFESEEVSIRYRYLALSIYSLQLCEVLSIIYLNDVLANVKGHSKNT